jgi:hypothetical protein
VFRWRKESSVPIILNNTHVAERATLVSQLLEYFSGVSESQNPPESSGSSRSGSKRIVLKSWGMALPYLGPRIWA